MNDLDRFVNTMEYVSVDRVPNHELCIWAQTWDRWVTEGMPQDKMSGDFFPGLDYLGLDRREFIDIHFDMCPAYEEEILERTERHEIIRHTNGVVTKALVDGTSGGMRSSMDQYLRFPVENADDFRELQKRFVAAADSRYPCGWEDSIPRWETRDIPLILGRNCAAGGFYWRAREWMGTENLSYAWYDQPDLMHEMMEFYADFTIETAKPILAKTSIEYFNLNEDFAMKNGPLLSPDTFRKFIYQPMKRVVDFFKSNGAKYVTLDSDGNPQPLIPMLMDLGIDLIWPCERAADMNPVDLRLKFGKKLRLSGGVDKRELAKGPEAIDAHLKELIPVVEQGGFIPTVDHAVSPDISWDNFRYYMELKHKLLDGRL